MSYQETLKFQTEFLEYEIRLWKARYPDTTPEEIDAAKGAVAVTPNMSFAEAMFRFRGLIK